MAKLIAILTSGGELWKTGVLAFAIALSGRQAYSWMTAVLLTVTYAIFRRLADVYDSRTRSKFPTSSFLQLKDFPTSSGVALHGALET